MIRCRGGHQWVMEIGKYHQLSKAKKDAFCNYIELSKAKFETDLGSYLKKAVI